MSDPTRDEIRRACEAVGWEWLSPSVTSGGDDQSSAWDGQTEGFRNLRRPGGERMEGR